MVTLAEAGVEVTYPFYISSVFSFLLGIPKWRVRKIAQLAQFWLACLTENQEVAGSNPALGILF